MLTPYDELPVHQSPYPFSVAPIADYSFDDGYYFGVFSAERSFPPSAMADHERWGTTC